MKSIQSLLMIISSIALISTNSLAAMLTKKEEDQDQRIPNTRERVLAHKLPSSFGRAINTLIESIIIRTIPLDILLLIDKAITQGITVINKPNLQGRTLLHHVALFKHEAAEQAFQKLIAAGADINALDNYGLTPLHLDVAARNVPVVILLLQKIEIFVNFLSNNNIISKQVTPLHLAVFNNDPNIISLLLEAGANSKQPDDRNITPLDWARGLDHHKSRIILESYLKKRPSFNA